MSAVSGEERNRREKRLGAVVSGVMLAGILGLPAIGWFGAFIATFWMASKAFVNSSNRWLDVSLCFGGLIVYAFVIYLTMGSIAAHGGRMWFWGAAWCGIWIWVVDARVGLFDA